MKFYLEKRVLVGFFLAFSILVGLAYFLYVNNIRASKTADMVAHTNEVLFHLEQSQSAAFQLEALLLKYVISGDSSFLRLYQQELASGAKHVVRARELTVDNAEQQTLIDSLRAVGRKKVQYNQRIIKARQESMVAARVLIPSDENGKLQNGITEIIDKMQDLESHLLKERVEENKKYQQRFYTSFGILLLTIGVVLALVFLAINGSLNARTQAEERTKQLNQELEAFTYSVSHDLRAPLRSVDGYAKVLFEDYGARLDEEGHRVISVIMNNARKMGNLIDDLLEFSRIGRKEITRMAIDMNALVQDVVRTETGRAVFSIDELPSVRGDQNLMRQVWVNLISNAVKYSSKHEHPSIAVSSYLNDGHVVFSVKDNGVGFDMQYVHKLFGVFQRLHHTKEFEGTGVGLALVQRIVQKHGGNVWAEGMPDKGATFYFSLPVSDGH